MKDYQDRYQPYQIVLYWIIREWLTRNKQYISKVNPIDISEELAYIENMIFDEDLDRLIF